MNKKLKLIFAALDDDKDFIRFRDGCLNILLSGSQVLSAVQYESELVDRTRLKLVRDYVFDAIECSLWSTVFIESRKNSDYEIFEAVRSATKASSDEKSKCLERLAGVSTQGALAILSGMYPESFSMANNFVASIFLAAEEIDENLVDSDNYHEINTVVCRKYLEYGLDSPFVFSAYLIGAFRFLSQIHCPMEHRVCSGSGVGNLKNSLNSFYVNYMAFL